MSTRATLITIPVVWIIYLAAVPVMAWSSVSTLKAWPEGTRPAEQPGTTYLVVGSDSRKGLTEEQQKDLKTGKDTDIGGGRTDTIMMLHTGAGKPTLVSIPRDSIVAIPGYSTTKINAAYAFGGPELLVQTLEENTGVRIDRYVEIGFAGVVSLVDAVGGVEICPEEDMDDDKAGLDVEKGCQEVDGKTALGYSRTRKFASGDIQRVQNQREVIGGLGSKLRSPMTVIDPIRYLRVVTGGASSVSVDDTASVVDMARFALALSGAMGSNGRNCNVPDHRPRRELGPRSRPGVLRAPAHGQHRRSRRPLHQRRPATRLRQRYLLHIRRMWSNARSRHGRIPVLMRTDPRSVLSGRPQATDFPHHGVACCRAPSSSRCRGVVAVALRTDDDWRLG